MTQHNYTQRSHIKSRQASPKQPCYEISEFAGTEPKRPKVVSETDPNFDFNRVFLPNSRNIRIASTAVGGQRSTIDSKTQRSVNTSLQKASIMMEKFKKLGNKGLHDVKGGYDVLQTLFDEDIKDQQLQP